MKAECILFDLDGTLLNTNSLVLNSLKHTVKTHLGIETDEREFYKYFGRPLVDIMSDLDPSQAMEMVETYRTYNASRHDTLTTLFPQVTETVRELKDRGIPMGVVTSKIKHLAERGLKLFGLEEYFDVCVAYEDTARHKPEPDPVLKALEHMDLQPSPRVIMVGDSPYDILCANRAGIVSAAVDWSLHPREVLEVYKPSVWLTEFSSLLRLI